MQKTFSPSSLGCFEKCPKQYHFRYVLRLPAVTEGIEAFVGKRVHEVLERLYQFVGKGMVPSLAKVQARYQQLFDEHFDPSRTRIVHRDVDVDFYRKHGERCLENYYRSHYPFDADETLGLEERIAFALDAERNYKMRGVIDRLVRARDGALEIHDFKTGRYVPRQAEIDRDEQLGLYELGLRQTRNEDGPVRLVWHYLLSGIIRRSERTPEQRDALRADTKLAIDRIRNESEWRTRKSRLCDWCEYRARCPAFGGDGG